MAALTSEPYVDLTLDAIAAFGGRVEAADGVYRVWPGRAGRAPEEITVEPDYSAVGYPAAAAALTGGEVFLEDLAPGSRQGDRGFVDLLAAMGATLSWEEGGLRVAGRAGRRPRPRSKPTSKRCPTRCRPWRRWRPSPAAPR